MKINYRKTFLIGFGFFASSIAWSMYNSYVPKLLEGYISSTMLIGFIMTIDNIFGVIFQPLFGMLSDKTRTRLGRRMPYMLVGIPICAVAFAVIPYTTSLWSLMTVVILFNFVMSTWRSPVVALMPDLTPAHLRSQANGVINLMGGVGSLISFVLGGILFNLGGYPLPFLMSAVVMVAALVLLLLFVREPVAGDLYAPVSAGGSASAPPPPAARAPRRVTRAQWVQLGIILAVIVAFAALYRPLDAAFTAWLTGTMQLAAADAHMLLRLLAVAAGALALLSWALNTFFGEPKEKRERISLTGGEKRSLLLILSAIFFWFTGYNAIETFFTLYATNVLGITTGAATMLLAFFSVTFIAVAVPAGLLGNRIGRRKTIMLGLVGVMALFIPMYFVSNLWALRVLLLAGGAFWSFVNINSLPMVVEMAGSQKIGTFTGYYYLFSFSAAIISPTLFGWIRDVTQNYRLIFIYAAVSFILALVCMLFVRHGEADRPAHMSATQVLEQLDD